VSATARLLLVRGLILVEAQALNKDLPPSTSGQTLSINCAGWVDQWIYDLASARRVSMRAIAQAALILALEDLAKK